MKQVRIIIHVGEKWGGRHHLAGQNIGVHTLRTAYRQFGFELASVPKNAAGEIVGGLTQTKGVGYWQGIAEPCTLFTLYLSEQEYRYAAAAIARVIGVLKDTLKQDAIMVTTEQVDTLEFL